MYDLVNCGPRQAFTVIDKHGEPLLVHNCYLYEPRRRKDKILPFISWGHQDLAIAAIYKYMGIRSIGIEKSRGEGASWLVLMCFLHQWLFEPMSTFGCVSKDKDTAADATNPDSLFFKIAWQLGKLPPWMLPKGFVNSKHVLPSKPSIYNPELECTFNFYSATGNVASGARKTGFFLDELSKFPKPDDEDAMASTQPVTDMRILVSTPFGTSGAYYDAMHVKGTTMLKLILHWPMNPTRNKGLYCKKNGVLEIYDKGYKFPENFEFIGDGKLRSPWYDFQASQPGMIENPRRMAQEYDLDYGGSTSKFYDKSFKDIVKKFIKPPNHIGEIDYDSFGSTGNWIPDPGGKVRIWMPLSNGHPPPGDYVVGVDIAAGLAGNTSANSAIVVVDKVTGSQVLEWVDNRTRPVECAQLAIALCKWLGSSGEKMPLLNWDNIGVGENFTLEVIAQGYPNIYYQRGIKRRSHKKTQKPGYRGTYPAKMHEMIRRLMLTGQITVKSERLFDELDEFEYLGDKVVHVGSERKDDAATGKSHGDIVTALGMVAVTFTETSRSEMKSIRKKEPEVLPNWNSLEGRFLMYEQMERQDDLELSDW